MSHQIRSELQQTEISFLQARMNEFNQTHGAVYDWKPLHRIAEDSNAEIIGGLLGWTLWSFFHIDTLWVNELHRKSGIGSELILSAEREAIQRGCVLSEVDTFCFQARGFYEKLGYEVFGQIEGIAGFMTRYYLRKSLDSGKK